MRKRLFSIGVGLAAIVALTSCSSPGDAGGSATESVAYPEGPITYVIPFNPGGSTDPVGREFSRMLGEKLDATVVVENLPGGDETIGVSSVVDAESDGQRIGLSSWSGAIVQPLINSDLSYGGVDDYTPIVKMVDAPNALVVAKDSPYGSLEDLLAAAKSRPGEITVGSSGRLVNPSFAMLVLEDQAGVDLNVVPFSGGAGEAITATLGGQIDAAIVTASGQLGLIESGEVRVLGHTGDESYSDVVHGPSFAEEGYDIPYSAEFMTLAPAGLDDAVRTRLTDAAYEIVSSDEWAKWCADNGIQADPMRGDELESWIADVAEAGQKALDLANATGF